MCHIPSSKVDVVLGRGFVAAEEITETKLVVVVEGLEDGPDNKIVLLLVTEEAGGFIIVGLVDDAVLEQDVLDSDISVELIDFIVEVADTIEFEVDNVVIIAEVVLKVIVVLIVDLSVMLVDRTIVTLARLVVSAG